jgi:hypothetical protein
MGEDPAGQASDAPSVAASAAGVVVAGLSGDDAKRFLEARTRLARQ